MRRLRIAILHRHYAPSGGGAERYAAALAAQLAQRHEVHVYAQHIAPDAGAPGVTVHPVSAPWARPRWLNQLWYATATWWATRRGFDIVHAHENTWHGNVQTVHVLPVWHNHWAGRSGWKRWSRSVSACFSPRLWTYLGLEALRFRVPDVQRPVAGAEVAQPGALARCVIATSEPVRAILAQTFPACVPALRVLTPGIEAVHEPSPAERREARAQLQLAADAQWLVFVGNDFAKKGLDTLLQAMALLPPQACLLVVGNGGGRRGHDAAAGFQARARALGLTQRVVFAGALADVSVAYRAADLLVHPTREDTFAMVVLEAMAAGRPVVVSAAPWCGMAAMLRAGEDASLLSDPFDAAGLAAAVQPLLNDAPLRARRRERGLAFAAAHTWEAKAREQEALYACCVRP